MTNPVHGMSSSRPGDSTLHQEKRVNQEGTGPIGGARSIRFVAANQLPVSPIDWLVADYLERNTLAVLYGGPGKGKSFFAIDLACCVATGTRFHGQAVRQGAVFYIAGEGHQGLARRLRAWSVHHRVSLDDMPLYISSGPIDMANPEHAFEQSGHAPSLIVIDTLSRNFSGDENSAADMDQGIARNRFHEAKETLISRGLVRFDWPHVFLVDPPTR